MTYKRDFLKENSILYLDAYDTDRTCEFRITKVIGDPGSSAVCYEATMRCKVDIPGTLKEFYPTPFAENDPGNQTSSYRCNLIRQKSIHAKMNNQLILTGKLSNDQFREFRDCFVDSYSTIRTAKQQNSDLWDAIPYFEIFKGHCEVPDADNYTVYVWTPYDNKLKTFEEILLGICEDTAKNKNKVSNLSLILESIKNLAECIKALHCSKLRHLDIKPENFGIRLTDGSPNGNITLFDINTIYSSGDHQRLLSLGTPGFRSPKIKEYNSGQLQKCDFFSIGACLYYSLVMRKNEKGELVNCHFIPPEEDHMMWTQVKENLEKIDVNIALSPLFNDCEFTEDSEIIKKLSMILKRCFSVDNAYAPYDSAGDIVDDLNSIISTWNGLICVENTKNTKRIATVSFQDKEYVAERGIKLGAEGAIQWLLYERPLYKACSKNKALHILTLGGGLYASKFIDIAFQLMQLDGYETEITVASSDVERDMSIFLAKRPGFSQFFHITTVLHGETQEFGSTSDALGKIRFVSIDDFAPDNSENNERILSDICSACQVNRDYFSYIFVALHQDLLNYHVAKTAERFFCCGNVNFVVFGDQKPDSAEPVLSLEDINEETIYAVDINKTVDQSADYDFLNRMAFNVHLTWCGSLEDLGEARRSYAEQYNRSSSFANALSIKYKLFSVGIELNSSDPYSSAKAFEKTIKDDPIFRSLVMYEHRRWIVETVSKGFSTLPQTQFDALKDKTKDEINKKHPCLVPCSDSWTLCDADWQKNNCENWNEASFDMLDKLDALDRMSVTLHRHFVDLSQKRLSFIRCDVQNLLDEIFLILKNDRADTTSFNAYKQALAGLLSEKNIGRLKANNFFEYYSGIFNAFLTSSCSSSAREQINKLTQKIRSYIFPVLQSCRYVIWKLNDKTIIENIPFILTYSAYTNLILPVCLSVTLHDLSQTDSVAAILTVNPLSATFLVDDGIMEQKDRFINYLKYVLRLIDNHNLQTVINIVVLQYNTIKPVDRLDFSESIKRISDKINHIQIQSFSSEDFACCLDEYLEKNKDGIGQNVLILSSSSSVTQSNPTPIYTVDQNTHKLICHENDIGLGYIPFKSSLSVADIYAVDDMIAFEEPELQNNYAFFWELYKKIIQSDNGKTIWKNFVEKLEKHSGNKVFFFDDADKPLTTEFSAFLPIQYKNVAELLADLLIKEGFAENCTIEHCMSSSIHIHMYTTEDISQKLKRLFSEYRWLLSEQEIRAVKKGKSVGFEYENLFVDCIALTTDEANLLRRISEQGYLLGPDLSDPNRAAFMFCSAQVKHLLIQENMILGLYVYYNAIASGVFDDIKIMKPFKESNTFIVVATKGLQVFCLNHHGAYLGDDEGLKNFCVPIHMVEVKGDSKNAELFHCRMDAIVKKTTIQQLFREL